MAIRIYIPEGQTPYTSRVRMETVETHIAARDRLADEAKMLREFAAADDIPDTLGDGAWRYESDGTDERGDYVRYVAAKGEEVVYRYATDAVSGTVTATSLEAAYASLREDITDEEIEDGATLWVESPSRERITLGIDGE